MIIFELATVARIHDVIEDRCDLKKCWVNNRSDGYETSLSLRSSLLVDLLNLLSVLNWLVWCPTLHLFFN